MEIRLAESKDIPGICVLYNEFYIYNAGQQPRYYKKATETGKYPKSVIENDSEDIFIAVDGNTVIGLIHITEEKTLPYDCLVQHRFALVVDLFVRDSFRNKGVGGQLFETAKQWAKTRGLDYIELNVLAENINGIRFYEHKELKTVSHTMRYML